MVAHVIRDDPAHARWYENFVRNRNMMPAIMRAFDALHARSE
jgi:hypothetical protein